MTDEAKDGSGELSRDSALTIERTVTGCWSVRSGGVQIAFAMTRAAAERERDTLTRLGRCTERRAGTAG